MTEYNIQICKNGTNPVSESVFSDNRGGFVVK